MVVVRGENRAGGLIVYLSTRRPIYCVGLLIGAWFARISSLREGWLAAASGRSSGGACYDERRPVRMTDIQTHKVRKRDETLNKKKKEVLLIRIEGGQILKRFN